MTIIGSNDKMIKSTKDTLRSIFDLKDFGPVDAILGIKILYTSDGLMLNQSYHVVEIMENFNKDGLEVARTSLVKIFILLRTLF